MKSLAVAVSSGLVLMLFSQYLGGAFAAQLTSLSLSKPPETIDTTSEGQTLVFTGELVNSKTHAGIPNAKIDLFQQLTFSESALLASGETDADGSFAIPWVVDIARIVGTSGGSSGVEDTQGRDERYQVVVVAKFAGDDQYAQSISNTQAFEVALNVLKVKAERKVQYSTDEIAVIKVLIVDNANKFIDPDKITAWFDGRIVMLQKQGAGRYTFTTTPLTTGAHMFSVLAEKKGYTTDDELVTVEAFKRKTVLTVETESSAYSLEETIRVSASLVETNSKIVVKDRMITGSLTLPTGGMRQLQFVDGKASYTISKNDPIGTWLLFVDFAGDTSYLPISSRLSLDISREDVVPPVEEDVSLSTPVVSGGEMQELGIGGQVAIKSSVKSMMDETTQIVYIGQVKNADDITVAIFWVEIEIDPGQELQLQLAWTPDEAGEYTTEVFVWDSIEGAQPLSSESKQVSITVT